MNQLIKFNNKEIRISGTKDDILFCGIDICKILGLSNTFKAISTIPDKYKVRITQSNSQGHQRLTTFISEPALYKLIFKSTKQEAIKFQEFVFEDLLPSIRKYGVYPPPEHQEFKNKVSIITEEDLHKAFVKYLKQFHQNVLVVSTLGELQDTKAKREYAYKMGYRGGLPDIILFHDSRVLFIELKSPETGGTLSKNQIKCHKFIRENSFDVVTTNNFFQLVHFLNKFLSNNSIEMSGNKTEYNKKALENYIFEFGKYKGKSAREVLQIQPSYISWLGSVNKYKSDVEYLKTGVQYKSNEIDNDYYFV